MPSCKKCGAFVDEKGKWDPAAHLSAVCTERDKAVREAVEYQWAIGAMRGEVTKAHADLDALAERNRLKSYQIDEALALLANGDVARAIKRLKNEPLDP